MMNHWDDVAQWPPQWTGLSLFPQNICWILPLLTALCNYDLAYSNQNESPVDQVSAPMCWAQNNSAPSTGLNTRAKMPRDAAVTHKGFHTYSMKTYISIIFCVHSSHMQWLHVFGLGFVLWGFGVCFLYILVFFMFFYTYSPVWYLCHSAMFQLKYHQW